MERVTSILADSSIMTTCSLLHHTSSTDHAASVPNASDMTFATKGNKRKKIPPESLQPPQIPAKSKRMRPSPQSTSPILEIVTPEHLTPLPTIPQSHYLSGHFSSPDDDCPLRAHTLVSALSNILESICAFNGSISRSWNGLRPYQSPQFPDGSASIFYSLQMPSITLYDYIERLVRYLQVSSSVFVAALVLLDRAHAADDSLALTHLNVHRLLTTALGISTKYLEDESYRNSTVGRIGGIPTTAEMNLLEAQFLRRLRWNCAVSPQTFLLYERNVFGRAL